MLLSAIFALWITPANAAAPRYILISGPGLSKPVLLSDWNENLNLMLAFANAPRARSAALRGLATRPRFELALFWGVPDKPVPTNPAKANQFDWFYPAQRRAAGRPRRVRQRAAIAARGDRSGDTLSVHSVTKVDASTGSNCDLVR